MKTDMAEPQTPNQPAPAEEKLFTLSEISQRTGISMPTLQRYKKTYQDRLPSVGAGRKQRYPEHALPVFAELRSENAGRRGRPRKNAAATASGRSSATAKRRPGRPAGAKRGRPAAARAAKPARGAAKTGRRPGRPRKVQPAAPARRGRPPGRPRKAAAGRRALPVRRGRVGRPPGSGRRAAGAGRRPGRPPGSGRRPGRPAAARRSAGRSKTEGLLTLTQISKTTGISYPTLVRYVRLYSNRLPHAGKGRARRFYPEAVDVFRSLRQESGRGGRRPGRGRRAAPGTARRGRPPKAAASGLPGRLEAILVQRVRDLERFRQDVEKRFGDLVKGLQKLR
jgi:predicted DNA-binding transcriptional regulator AlpA